MIMGDESTSVRVAVRIRPQIARELIDMCRVCTSVTPGEPQVWLGSDKAFTYDYLFDTASAQQEVYASCVEGLVEGCFDGYNATVLAYGQTGSGKTYTMGTGLEMDNGPDMVGIIPRAVHHLFGGIESRILTAKEQGTAAPDFKITAHFMELYNEDIIDLFDPGFKSFNKSKVKIHEDGDGEIYVTGMTTKTIVTVEEALECLRTGALSRTTGSTNMNTQSSRSHAIFTLLIRQQRLMPPEDPENPSDVPEYETLTAKFHFVDLAGSERLKRTGATGQRQREGISINCGLLALGNVISALGDISKKASHVPYRDSKLTRLLQDSLGGNSRTLMIACVSPSDTDFMETLSTLKYANRARNIKNRVTVNQDKSSRTIAFLRQEIQELRIELMEFKQGKRIIGENGSEGINDMFHENQLLTTELNNLRTRIRALQDTIEMMTTQNASLLAEKTIGQWGQDTPNSDIATVIHGHLKEMEELRVKLCESQSHCTHLQKQLNNQATMPAMRMSMMSSTQAVSMSGSFIAEDEQEPPDVDELLKEAKEGVRTEMEAMQKMKQSFSSVLDNEDDENYDSDDEEDSSDESDEEKENYNEELADLTSEISIKQKLIESLETSQRKLQGMKFQYEEKLNILMNRIKATQDERDKVLSNIRQTGGGQRGGEDKVKTVRQDYQRKLASMEDEMKKLKSTLKDHSRLMKERTQQERQLRTMKSDLGDMKKTKVKLINKMRDESQRAKKEDLKKNKEIAQLRKDQRKKESYIKNLEADNRLKKAVLRRKTEELCNIKKVPRRTMRNRVTGKFRREAINSQMGFSPKVAKHRWQSLEQVINKVAYNKQTVSSLERDMNRWLKERESLSKQLEKVRRKRERIDPCDYQACCDLNEQMEALKANIDYILENIRECQENIMSMEESKEFEATSLLESTETSTLTSDELQYMVSKLITMSVNQSTIAAERQAAIGELEGKVKQMEQTTSVQEQLLAHVLRDNDMNVYHLMTSLVAGDDNTPGSTESSRSSSPTDWRTDKARCKTATTQDMLFTSDERKSRERSLSASTQVLSEMDNLNPSTKVFGPKGTESHSAPPTLDPRMTTSLEGSLGNHREKVFDPKSSSSSSNYSLKIGSQAYLGPAVLNLPRDYQYEVTPPSSPIPYRRATSKEDNVFSRLTSTTASYRQSFPHTGEIKIHINKGNGKPFMSCTHRAQGHSRAILSLCATKDYVISGSKDRTVKVWDLNLAREISTLGNHPNNVNCVKYSHAHRTVFSVSSSYIKVWDLREDPAKCTKTLTSSGLTSNGSLNQADNSRTLQMPPGEFLINDIALSDRDDILYSAAGNIVRMWDLRKFMSVGKLAGGHQAAVMCLATRSDRNKDIVVTGSKDHYMKVFDVAKKDSGLVSPRHNLDPPHYDGVQSLALSGNVLFSGSRDMCIKKWDIKTAQMTHTMNNAHKDWVCALKFLPGGRIILSGCRSGVVRMWSADTCRSLGTIRAHDAPINAITTNDVCIFTASSDCSIGLWRMRAGYERSPELSDAA